MLPYVSVRRIDFDRADELLIYFTGGPLREVPDIVGSPEFFRGLETNQIIVFPLYPGTIYRSSGEPSDDMATARAEVAELEAKLRREFPIASFVAVGESFGSYLAAQIKLTKDDKLVLLSAPFGYNGTDMRNYLDKTTSERRKAIDTSFPMLITDPNKRLPVNRYAYVRAAVTEFGSKEFSPISAAHSDACAVAIYGRDDPLASFAKEKFAEGLSKFDQVVALAAGHKLVSSGGQKPNVIDLINKSAC